MKFSVLTKDILPKLNLLARVAGTVPSLSAVRIVAKDGLLYLQATDGYNTLIIKVGSRVEETGVCFLPLHALQSTIKGATGRLDVTVTDKADFVFSKGKAALSLAEGVEFTPISYPPKQFAVKNLSAVVKQMAPFTARKDDRAYLTGVHLSRFHAYASDNLHLLRLPYSFDQPVTLTPKAVSVLADIDCVEAQCTVTNDTLYVWADDFVLTTQTIFEPFPIAAYDNLFPAEEPLGVITTTTDNLKGVLTLIEGVAKDYNSSASFAGLNVETKNRRAEIQTTLEGALKGNCVGILNTVKLMLVLPLFDRLDIAFYDRLVVINDVFVMSKNIY